MGTIFVDNLEPQSGTSLTLGASGDAINLATGATAGFGKIGQVHQFDVTDNTSTSSTSYVATDLTDQITPTATNSKILVSMTGGRSSFSGGVCEGKLALYRQIDGGGFSLIREFLHGFIQSTSGGGYGKTFAFTYLDSPNTQLAVDYKLYFKTNANTFFVNSDNSTMTITLMEILA